MRKVMAHTEWHGASSLNTLYQCVIKIAVREVSGKGEKERYTHLNAEFQRIARRDNKAFLSEQSKEIEENIRMGKTEISSRKLEIPR